MHSSEEYTLGRFKNVLSHGKTVAEDTKSTVAGGLGSGSREVADSDLSSASTLLQKDVGSAVHCMSCSACQPLICRCCTS